MAIKNVSELIAEFTIDTLRLKYAMTHNEMVIKTSMPIDEGDFKQQLQEEINERIEWIAEGVAEAFNTSDEEFISNIIDDLEQKTGAFSDLNIIDTQDYLATIDLIADELADNKNFLKCYKEDLNIMHVKKCALMI
ncbi:hypothetical protein [Enterococcus cecorum]|uniref:hypothetical protein n=1 Tax=Enterococcus cecorum TaxID=44008 RepID=UPI000A875641|nr:hypothetical protein [Enterococcus cecorum]CAI3499889.1 hypothetical protein CIRMBP1308_01898 [Enterococcus cecorum]CAI3502689.1 hypothetical protein CIRMBP1307_02025 [Enterococcus cecorum]